VNRFRLKFMPGYDLTDGVWVWPKGLAHDVAEHGVRLPPEFLATAEGLGWAVPAGPPAEELLERAARGYDSTSWRAWHRQTRRPWYAPW
jgi:hypothetical protein